MTRFEVGYQAKNGKNYRYTFKSDKQLAYHRNWNYGIGMPMWQDMAAARIRIEEREDTTMHRVGHKRDLYIKNLETGYMVTIGM